MSIQPKLQTVILAAILALSCAVALPAAAYQCEEPVTQVLRDHGISQNDVKSVNIERRSGGGKSSQNYMLDAWVRLNSCANGALVVNMTRYCMVQQSYTTGDCKVGNLPRY